MPLVPRAPVMVPTPQARRGLAVVRRRRLLVEDGALVLRHEGGRREVLADRGQVVGAWWTPVAAAIGLTVPYALAHSRVTDVLILERRDALPLVLRLADWLPVGHRTPSDIVTGTEVAGWPGPPEDPSLSAAVRVSGAAALVAALGPELLGAAGEQRLNRLRGVLSSGWREVRGVVDVPAALHRLAVAAMLVVVVLLLVVIFPGVDSATRLVLIQLMGLLGAGVVAARVVLLVQATRLRDAVTLPEPVWRPAPTVPTSRRFVERSMVSAGPDWLVVRDQHDREGWTPGPALGGVTTVRITWPWLSFHDADDARLWLIKADEWLAQSELAGWVEQLRVAGYTVAGDAPPGPNDRWWFGVPIFAGMGVQQQPVGVFGQWSESGYVVCAMSLALQVRVQQFGGATSPDAELAVVVAVPPGLALIVGLIGVIRNRREQKGTRVAQPPRRAGVAKPRAAGS